MKEPIVLRCAVSGEEGDHMDVIHVAADDTVEITVVETVIPDYGMARVTLDRDAVERLRDWLSELLA